MNLPIKEFQFTFTRSSGSGGQNVNKVNSKAILTWNLDQTKFLSQRVIDQLKKLYPRRVNSDFILTISSQRFRDQPRNIADCISKLEAMIIRAKHRPKARKATSPTKASKEKRLKEKKRKSEIKKLRGKF